jgi:hypothetical protein
MPFLESFFTIRVLTFLGFQSAFLLFAQEFWKKSNMWGNLRVFDVEKITRYSVLKNSASHLDDIQYSISLNRIY